MTQYLFLLFSASSSPHSHSHRPLQGVLTGLHLVKHVTVFRFRTFSSLFIALRA